MTSKKLQSLFDFEPKPLRKWELDYADKLFGVKITKMEYGNIIELYIEDDEWWHFQCSFNEYWLPDLLSVLKYIQDKK